MENVGSKSDEAPGVDYERCGNCRQWIPTRTLNMHKAFCERNNKACLICGLVMKKEDFPNHWHCGLCSTITNLENKTKHLQMVHSPISCTCGEELFLESVPDHRKKICPDRLIICRFCHLLVKAGPISREVRDIYYGSDDKSSTVIPLTEHESECGARTIQCTNCKQQVQLKMVKFHMNVHKIQRRNQKPPVLCSNKNCSKLLSGGRASGNNTENVMELCSSCYTPFWSSRYDQRNQKLIGKVAEKYQNQMTNGCEKDWCFNKYCASSLNPNSVCHNTKLSPTDSAVHLITLLHLSKLVPGGSNPKPEYNLCVVDRVNANRRVVAETMLAPTYQGEIGINKIAWCVKALEECADDLERSSAWLNSFAPTP
ncbi:hypothetical protein HK096_001412 [Nowakowskiella sp. JEL0078]|nr:hypothetical protein HK096_001412 [Nowakowskiella sp. JEL0078]